MADNFIETDGGAHNLRVYNNRGINVWHSALSSQPVFGGPAYFIRNVIHTAGDALKFSARPTGMMVFNNTFCTETRVSSYSNGHFRNNLFLGHVATRPTMSSMSYTAYTSFDYNGYRTKPDAKSLFQWTQPTDRLQDFTLKSEAMKRESLKHWKRSVQRQVRRNTASCLITTCSKASNHPIRTTARVSFRSRNSISGCARDRRAVDVGCELPNLTDGFTGDAPDLGAYELGKPLPVYGPREGAGTGRDNSESLVRP